MMRQGYSSGRPRQEKSFLGGDEGRGMSLNECARYEVIYRLPLLGLQLACSKPITNIYDEMALLTRWNAARSGNRR